MTSTFFNEPSCGSNNEVKKKEGYEKKQTNHSPYLPGHAVWKREKIVYNLSVNL
jgi:hypothetical protein